MEITNVSRGAVKMKIGNRELTISGEAMMPKPPTEQSEYVIYESSIKHWDSPWENEVVDKSLKNEILKFIEKEFERRNLKMIIE